MLRLVHPATEGQDPPPRRRKGHKPAALSLTADEARHTRAALKNAARAFGGFDVLATVMGVPVETLYGANVASRPISGTFAIRIAHAAGVSVEAMLSGALNAAGRCSTCGHRAGDGRLVTAAGGAR